MKVVVVVVVEGINVAGREREVEVANESTDRPRLRPCCVSSE